MAAARSETAGAALLKDGACQAGTGAESDGARQAVCCEKVLEPYTPLYPEQTPGCLGNNRDRRQCSCDLLSFNHNVHHNPILRKTETVQD